jgi:glycosyltransferase involved in cell wall biosynthesis
MSLTVAIVGPPLDVLYGGQEVQASSLLTHWQKDPEVAATFISSRPPFPKPLAALNRVPYLRTLVRLPSYLVNLFRALGKVELVHIFAGSLGTFRMAATPAFAVARLRGKKVLIHYHSGRGDEHLRSSTLARHILRSSDLVVVPSEYLAASFRLHGLSPVVVANVVDPERYPYRPRNPLQPRLLCTRNLEEHYGIDIVVRAFARVQRDFPKASLCLVGSGQQAPEIRKLVEELSLHHVQLMGAVQPAEMPAIYDQSDIFVNGSYVDCAPVSLVEAFCSGLPVVTTAAGGIPYLVEHERTGLLCPAGDWAALAENVVRLMRHPNLARMMAERAHQHTGLHSWHRLRELWLTAYRDTLERPRHAEHMVTTPKREDPLRD